MTSHPFDANKPARVTVLIPRVFIVTPGNLGPMQVSERESGYPVALALSHEHEAAGWRVVSLEQD